MTARYEVLILAYNEAATIETTIRTVLRQAVAEHNRADRVTVVSTACTDGTDDIVRGLAAADPLMRLLVLPVRRGKVFDVNEAVANSSAPILVIMDADIGLSDSCIPLLVERLAETPHAGMTVPGRAFRNSRDSLPSLVGHLSAEIQNVLAQPKAGQILAVRREYAAVDERVSVDDAYQEFTVLSAGLAVVRVPEATVLATAPRTLREYVRQRRRVSAQYLTLQAVTGYRPATCSLRRLGWAVVRTRTLRRDRRVDVLMTAVLAESAARLLGRSDFHLRKRTYFTWNPAVSTKSHG
jgi:cellulose synthase/poly-beta-1,6-N-acetylglucosamine synthase-like glycosyltransferase